jgi:hypothetical protein
MKPVVFSGPTLWSDNVLAARDLHFLPPAQVGDVYRAATARPPAIGIIDGQFETGPSIWHKEILFALSEGIHVYGAASMGALRAAELAPFGMRGIGAIYRDYRAGLLKDDDEVAVVHAPKEHGYCPMTEALVDIRATLALASARQVIWRATADTIERTAKATFFKERQWDRILDEVSVSASAGRKREITNLSKWLPANRVERKRDDALAMVRAVRRFVESGAPRFRPRFSFRNTIYWRRLVEASGGRWRRA